MTESLVTISIVGLLAGFIFSMPIAGPVSIFVTSKALNGRLRYCTIFAVGASLADLIYVFFAVYGVTRLYRYFKPVIPYILIGGAIIILFIGIKILRTKIDLEHIDNKDPLTKKIEKKEKGAFYTGFMMNFLNPTLFFGWLTTSFIIISIVSSLGFSTGGLENSIDDNVSQINSISGKKIEKPKIPSYMQLDTLQFLKKENHLRPTKPNPSYFHWLISLFFAVSVSIGTIIWFYLLASIINRHRHKINMTFLTWLIRSLGIILCCFGLFLFYTAAKMIL